MPRPRSNSPQRKGKGTSFGKKSDAEKNFRKKKISSRSGRGERPHSGGESANRYGAGSRSRTGGSPREVNAPFRRSAGASPGGGKSFRRADRSEGEGENRAPKTDRYSGNPRERDDSAPLDNREKRPFRKNIHPSSERGFKKPFSRPGRDNTADQKRDDRHEKRSFDKGERKSFVQSRVVTSADFTKPGKKSFVAEPESSPKESGLTRLNKFIANSGVGSRRHADELITMGLISVNGKTVTTLGTKVGHGDVVRYEDRVLKAEKLVYLLLNKPKGFITTTDDPQERNTVMGLVASACKERIYPVGRLDRNTTGLLLLTNDGDLADKLTHPSYKAKKVYKVELDRPLTKNDFQKILEGVHLEEGRAMVDDLAIISEDDKTVGLEIHIGWNRVVRRIFETLGYDVVRLDRSVFAGMDKKDLSRGQWRFLKPEEVVRLKHFK